MLEKISTGNKFNKSPNIFNEKWNKDQLYEKIIQVDGFAVISTEQFCENFIAFKDFYLKLVETSKLVKGIDVEHLVGLSKIIVAQPVDHINYIINKPNNVVNVRTDLTGLKFVFTGFRDSDLEKLITNAGGSCSTSVSSRTSTVIKQDGDDNDSSKAKTALKLNIPIIERTAFINKYNLK